MNAIRRLAAIACGVFSLSWTHAFGQQSAAGAPKPDASYTCDLKSGNATYVRFTFDRTGDRLEITGVWSPAGKTSLHGSTMRPGDCGPVAQQLRALPEYADTACYAIEPDISGDLLLTQSMIADRSASGVFLFPGPSISVPTDIYQCRKG